MYHPYNKAACQVTRTDAGIAEQTESDFSERKPLRKSTPTDEVYFTKLYTL